MVKVPIMGIFCWRINVQLSAAFPQFHLIVRTPPICHYNDYEKAASGPTIHMLIVLLPVKDERKEQSQQTKSE